MEFDKINRLNLTTLTFRAIVDHVIQVYNEYDYMVTKANALLVASQSQLNLIEELRASKHRLESDRNNTGRLYEVLTDQLKQHPSLFKGEGGSSYEAALKELIRKVKEFESEQDRKKATTTAKHRFQCNVLHALDQIHKLLNKASNLPPDAAIVLLEAATKSLAEIAPLFKDEDYGLANYGGEQKDFTNTPVLQETASGNKGNTNLS
jgi:hypothetical protein